MLELFRDDHSEAISLFAKSMASNRSESSGGKTIPRPDICDTAGSVTGRWWDIVFHTRPKRRESRALEKKIMKGYDADGLVWPVGNHKPHTYYW